jgi:hypothetical protein
MALEPDIIYSTTPELINLSFGKNMFSLYDQNNTGFKAGIQVVDNTNSEVFGTLQTYPNGSGYYHFDIQNILKNYTTPNYSAERYSTNLFTAEDESIMFKVRYGWVNALGTFNIQGTYPGTGATENCVVYGGRKQYWELDWTNNKEYITEIFGFGNCPIPGTRQKALTDWNIKKDKSKLTGGVPAWIPSGVTEVYTMEKREDDELILSFITAFDKDNSFPPPTGCDGIKSIRVTFFSGDTETADLFIDNTLTNGGGETNSLSTNRTWLHPYNAISIPLGRLNFSSEYNAGFTHFYVATYTYKGAACPSSTSGTYSTNPTSQIYRVDKVVDECNDFAPVQVSWLNSLGFRDYFYFSKRTDESINITRNNYEQVEGTWGSNVFQVPKYSRGNTTFSQDLTIKRTINTRYLSDSEAQYLKNLFISPDVRVRYDGNNDWIPVTLTNTSWTERTYRKDKLFQYTLTYDEAHKINSQRG